MRTRHQKYGKSAAGGPDTVLVKGIYTYSPEINRFLECGDDSTTYRVEDPDSLLSAGAREYQFFPSGRNSVFAELEAVNLPAQEGGTQAAEYDSLLKVVRVLNRSEEHTSELQSLMRI